MQFQSFAQRRLFILNLLFCIFQRRDSLGRRRRWSAQKAIQYEQTALHRRGARGVRGDDQDRSVREHAAARTALGQRDAAHFGADDVGDGKWVFVEVRDAEIVVLREALIEEGVISIDQLQHVTVLAHNVGKAHLGLLPQRAAQITIEFDRGSVETRADLRAQLFKFLLLLRREIRLVSQLLKTPEARALEKTSPPFLTAVTRQHDARVDVDAVHIADLQPLADEVFDQLL